MTTVRDIAAAAGANLQPPARDREIDVAATPAEVPESRRRCGGEASAVLLSGAELIEFYQRRGALPIPARAGRNVRHRIVGSDGSPRVYYAEPGR